MRTPKKNINKMGVFGPLKSFWRLLDGNWVWFVYILLYTKLIFSLMYILWPDENYVLNWSKERSPVVHQINHFHSELMELAISQDSSLDAYNNDSAWQALAATKCLFGCDSNSNKWYVTWRICCCCFDVSIVRLGS